MHWWGKDGLWCEAVPQEALNEHVLVVEQQHGGGLSLDWITAEMGGRKGGGESVDASPGKLGRQQRNGYAASMSRQI